MDNIETVHAPVRQRTAIAMFAALCAFWAVPTRAVADVSLASPDDPSATLCGKLRSSLRTNLHAHVTDHFLVTCTLDGQWASRLGQRLEGYYQRFFGISREAGLFARKPAEPLTWICLNDAHTYQAYASNFEDGWLPLSRSYYSSLTGRVILLQERSMTAALAAGPSIEDATPCREPLPNPIRTAHELAHQLTYRTGIQTRGVMYPPWLSEGLACIYETALIGATDFVADNPERLQRLLVAHEAARLQPLHSFLLARQVPQDMEARLDFYAASWGLVRFLHDSNRGAFRRYMALLSQLDPGNRPPAAVRSEFEQAFGDIDGVEAVWRNHVASLPLARQTEADIVE